MRAPDRAGTQLQTPSADPPNSSSFLLLFGCGEGARTLIPPLPSQFQQQDEEVDEVEIQCERAHQRLFGEYVACIARQINLLDPLRVPSGEAGENNDADH